MKDNFILCVEDNKQVQEFNKQLLEAKGFTVKLAASLAEARAEIERQMPRLIILDIHLPDGNGLDFLRELRKSSNIPVVALTDDNEEGDIVMGLASGCDDYVPKPYTFPVLYARVEALLRRVNKMPDMLEKGGLRLDFLASQAFLYDQDLLLTQKDFALLLLFTQNEDKVMSTDYLYEKVWKAPYISNAALKNAVSRLRKKLAGSGYTVVAARGTGYLFKKE